MTSLWTVRLAQRAEQDYRDILRWTQAHFGLRQAQVYARTISSALSDLSGGPSLVGVRRREDIGLDLYTLHVARKGRKGRHFVLFRISTHVEPAAIDVLRLLHDSMDLPEHASGPDDAAGKAR